MVSFHQSLNELMIQLFYQTRLVLDLHPYIIEKVVMCSAIV